MPRRLPIVLGVVLITLGSSPATAHRLKLFVTVEDGAIAGHAFFVGGGRPEGADIVVTGATGVPVYRGKTDDDGAFRFRPETAGDYRIVVDTGDGHTADTRVSAERFSAPSPVAPATGASATAESSAAAASDAAALAPAIEAAVDRAVARRLRPLLEAYAESEARLRFNDVMGGLGMIVGLAGAGLWALSRRRNGPAEPARGSGPDLAP